MSAAKSKAKRAKENNPLVLNAEVYRTGMFPALGKIVRVTKSLLTVKWDTGTTELYGRRGQAFHGRVDSNGEAITFSPSGNPLDDIWGGEDDVSIAIATEGAKNRIAEERATKAKAKQERAAKQAEIEADPTYQKRQADLALYSDALKGIGHVESSWGDAANFRIELDPIKPEEMPAVVEAIRSAREKK